MSQRKAHLSDRKLRVCKSVPVWHTLLTVALLLTVGCRAALRNATMNDGERIVHKLNAMWNSKDAAQMEVLYAADATHEDTTTGVELRGIAAIRDLFTSTWKATPDVRTDVLRVICDGEWVAWEWRMTATHTGDFPDLPATRRRFSIVGVSIMQIGDGKVVCQRDYYDQASFRRQVGVE